MTISVEQFSRESADMLRRALEGEEIVITKNGEPIAKLVPHGSSDLETIDERTIKAEAAIARIRELRKGNVLGPDLTIRQLIEEGRRF